MTRRALALALLLAGCASPRPPAELPRPIPPELAAIAGPVPPELVASVSPAAAPPPVPAALAPLPLPRPAIPLDERLEYSIRWLGIPVGTASLTTSPAKEQGLEGLVKLEFRARSNWYLNLIVPVQADLTSWVDPATGSPRRFTSRLKRGRERHESTLTFDPVTNVCTHDLPEGKRVQVVVTPATQDGISLLYHIRTVPLALGKPLPLTITADGKNWDLRAQVVRVNMVRVGALGRWPAVEGRGEMAYPVPFLKGALARVWLSADERRVPLMAKIRCGFGPVTVLLVRRSAKD